MEKKKNTETWHGPGWMCQKALWNIPCQCHKRDGCERNSDLSDIYWAPSTCRLFFRALNSHSNTTRLALLFPDEGCGIWEIRDLFKVTATQKQQDGVQNTPHHVTPNVQLWPLHADLGRWGKNQSGSRGWLRVTMGTESTSRLLPQKQPEVMLPTVIPNTGVLFPPSNTIQNHFQYQVFQTVLPTWLDPLQWALRHGSTSQVEIPAEPQHFNLQPFQL